MSAVAQRRASGGSRRRVLVTARQFNRSETARRHLDSHGCELIASDYGWERTDADIGEEELSKLLRGADAVIAGTARFSGRVIESAADLRIIARRGVGYEHVDVETATRRGVVVTVTRGAVEVAVAEHAFALILAVARRITEGDRLIKEGAWSALTGIELQGKTLWGFSG